MTKNLAHQKFIILKQGLYRKALILLNPKVIKISTPLRRPRAFRQCRAPTWFDKYNKFYVYNQSLYILILTQEFWILFKAVKKPFSTSYLTDSYIIFTLKMESVSKNAIFGLKMMVKSGLENIILKSLHAGR